MSCRRTFDAEKNKGFTWIICGRCWRLMPAELRAKHKRYNREVRKWERRHERRTDDVRIEHILKRWHALSQANSNDIRDFFRVPQKPEGLDAFLEIVGL